MNRPITTLFMLESLDGKISTGSSVKQKANYATKIKINSKF